MTTNAHIMNQALIKSFCLWAHDELTAHVSFDVAYDFFIKAAKLRYMDVHGYCSDAAYHKLLCGECADFGYIIDRLKTDITPDEWADGVRIIGWMHQYFMTSKKGEVYADYKRGKKAGKEEIAPATQLFTPHWIVSYLAENSLGRMWLEAHPDSALASQMAYFCQGDEGADNGEGTAFTVDTSADADASTHVFSGLPEDLTIVDPACGSGHILVEVFDLLTRMYEEAGYAQHEIPALIFTHNITGLEIDPKVANLASFALVMKACEYYPDFLRDKASGHVRPRIVCLQSLVLSPKDYQVVLKYFPHKDFWDTVTHLSECGSLFAPTKEQLHSLRNVITHATSELSDEARHRLCLLADQCEALVEHYQIVIANPPYMGSWNMGSWILAWMKKHYAQSYRDLCTGFIDRGFTLAYPCGYSAMITMHSWMFISSFKEMRYDLLTNHGVVTMAHLGSRAFESIGGEVVQTTAAVFSNQHTGKKGTYLRLTDVDGEIAKRERCLRALRNPQGPWRYAADSQMFLDTPGYPLAYWVPESLLKAFVGTDQVSDIAAQRTRISTCNNNRYLRRWFEVSVDELGRQNRWVNCPKGGTYRKWYGNNEYVLDWAHDGEELRASKRASLGDTSYFFWPGLTWSSVSTYKASFRTVPADAICDHAGPLICLKDREDTDFLLALLNSNVTAEMLAFLAPTLNFEWWAISQLPLPHQDMKKALVTRLAKEAQELSQGDWDESETSQDFKRSPLL